LTSTSALRAEATQIEQVETSGTQEAAGFDWLNVLRSAGKSFRRSPTDSACLKQFLTQIVVTGASDSRLGRQYGNP
jgi:hypothetical protein